WRRWVHPGELGHIRLLTRFSMKVALHAAAAKGSLILVMLLLARPPGTLSSIRWRRGTGRGGASFLETNPKIRQRWAATGCNREGWKRIEAMNLNWSAEPLLG